MEEDLARLTREVKQLSLAWEETYDKVSKSLRRLSRERVRLEHLDAEKPEGTADSPSEPSLPHNSGTHPGVSLTENQKRIQQGILRRRAGMQ